MQNTSLKTLTNLWTAVTVASSAMLKMLEDESKQDLLAVIQTHSYESNPFVTKVLSMMTSQPFA